MIYPGQGGEIPGGLPYKGPPISLQTVGTIIAALVGHDGKRVQSYLGTTLHQGSAGVRSYHFWQSQPHTQSPQPQESISTDHTISSKKNQHHTYLWSEYGNYIGTTQPCRTLTCVRKIILGLRKSTLRALWSVSRLLQID